MKSKIKILNFSDSHFGFKKEKFKMHYEENAFHKNQKTCQTLQKKKKKIAKMLLFLYKNL